MAIPPRVIILRDIPNGAMTMSVMSMDNGIDTNTIKVIRTFRKNRRIIMEASSAPKMPSFSIPLMEF
ncbi:hypothetical protein D3C81_2151270 [compost metagenome]